MSYMKLGFEDACTYFSSFAVDGPWQVDRKCEHAFDEGIVISLQSLAHFTRLYIEHYECCDVECNLCRLQTTCHEIHLYFMSPSFVENPKIQNSRLDIYRL